MEHGEPTIIDYHVRLRWERLIGDAMWTLISVRRSQHRVPWRAVFHSGRRV